MESPKSRRDGTEKERGRNRPLRARVQGRDAIPPTQEPEEIPRKRLFREREREAEPREGADYERVMETAQAAKRARRVKMRQKDKVERQRKWTRDERRLHEYQKVEEVLKMVRHIITRVRKGTLKSKAAQKLYKKLLRKATARLRRKRKTPTLVLTKKEELQALKRKRRELRAKLSGLRRDRPPSAEEQYRENRVKVVGSLHEKVISDITQLGTPRTRKRKYAAKYNVPPYHSPRRDQRCHEMLATAQRLLNREDLGQQDLLVSPEMVEEVIKERARKDTAP
ncbi:uncharacterized protein [Branchiostoma lanceolatum]|uniref:Hypp3452 protein n=1 Tax=Branchiostoma lanceolatum TaxID=7740 RepID=A0A8K0A313_BRALA|nr:Hypp3452 [Branchiostoma lanceolatum]